MKTLRIALAVGLAAGLVSCSPKPREIIVGKWQSIPGSPPPIGMRVQLSGPGVMTFDFRPDGAVITQGGVEVSATTVDGNLEKQGGSRPVTNHYSFVDDHTLKIAFAKGSRFEAREVTFKVAASRTRLALTETAPSGLEWAGAGGVITLHRIE